MIWVPYCYLKHKTYSNFSNYCYWCIFFSVPIPNPEPCIAFSCHVFLISNLRQFLSFLILMTLTLFKKVLFHSFPWFGFVRCFLMLEWANVLLRKISERRSICITCDINLDHLVKVVFVTIIHCNVFIFPFVIK